jgi:ABC-type nickel/cobalt efflux system permease component RcnA
MHESMLAMLGLGFVLGLRHATEADHLAAVSAIVSERRSIGQSAVVGALWGIGHTSSLLFAGAFVIVLGVAIPERIATILELVVALMIVFLGSRVLYVILRTHRSMHVHAHAHGGREHIHIHFHDEDHKHSVETTHADAHSGFFGWRPVLVGIVHGLAGSAALTLLVLSEIVRNGTPALGFAYLLVFGAGSIGGMLLMSCLIALPFSLGTRFFQRALLPLRVLAGVASTGFGFFYAWSILEKLSPL